MFCPSSFRDSALRLCLCFSSIRLFSACLSSERRFANICFSWLNLNLLFCSLRSLNAWPLRDDASRPFFLIRPAIDHKARVEMLAVVYPGTSYLSGITVGTLLFFIVSSFLGASWVGSMPIGLSPALVGVGGPCSRPSCCKTNCTPLFSLSYNEGETRHTVAWPLVALTSHSTSVCA